MGCTTTRTSMSRRYSWKWSLRRTATGDRTRASSLLRRRLLVTGENVHPGRPVLAIAANGQQWLSCNVREDFLHDLTVGTTAQVARAGSREPVAAVAFRLRHIWLAR